VNKRLTLNLGLRWDGVPHTYEAKNRMWQLLSGICTNPANAAILTANGNISPTSPGLGGARTLFLRRLVLSSI